MTRRCWHFFVAFSLLLTGFQVVVYGDSQELGCPACEAVFKAPASTGRGTPAGEDRDLLPREVDDQKILVDAIACPYCLYAANRNAWAPRVPLSEDVKDRIVKDKVLRLPGDVKHKKGRWDLPAWVRYDLIAQTSRLRNRPAIEEGFALLAASWSVRLAWHLPISFQNEKMQLLENWERENVNREEIMKAEDPAIAEIAAAEELSAKTAELEGEHRIYPGLLALYLFRTHGENQRAGEILSLLNGCLDPAQYEVLLRSLESSVELEQSYQRRALAVLQNVSQYEEAQDMRVKALATYLCGELNRRLGNFAEARRYLKDVRKLKPSDERIRQWAKEQLRLLP